MMRIQVGMVACAIALAGSVGAQEAAPQERSDAWKPVGSHRLRREPLDVQGCGISVAWPETVLDDAAHSRALAYAVAVHRAAIADRVLPQQVRTQIELGNGFTVLSAHVPADSLDAGARWLRALAGPFGDRADADVADRSQALAALAADDADWLYPGEALHGMARRAMFAAGDARAIGALGDASFLLSMPRESFVAALQAPVSGGLRVAIVGDRSAFDAVEAALLEIGCESPKSERRLLPLPQQEPSPLAFAPHPRIDAHYVACAFHAPQGPVSMARLVAIEVVRIRARTRFQSPRGNESLARAPFVQNDPLLGDPLLLLFRRGVHGASADVPRRELEELAAAIALPTQAAEFAGALAVVRSEWAAPPYGEGMLAALRVAPAAIATRARALVLRSLGGIGDADVVAAASLQPADVDAELQILSAARRAWFGLAPTHTDPLGG